MSRSHVEAVVKKYLAEVLDGLTVDTIDTHESMLDLGASSLDIVEIVSCSMRELRVKVPRSKLSEIDNIDGLIDLLCSVAQENTPKLEAV